MNAKKNALGRGLSALIEEASDSGRQQSNASNSAINEIEISLIDVNPFQPRQNFDKEALEELAASIKELGIIQPITVRQLDNGRYQLITGERRFRASQIAGLETMTAYIRTANDQDMLEMALVENIQREELDAVEIAISYQRLIEECNLTQEVLSDRVGKKRSTVANYLRLLKLPAEIQLGIRMRKISMGHARALVNVATEDIQLEIFNQVLEDDLSVRAVEDLVRNYNEPQDNVEVLPKPVKNSTKNTTSEELNEYQNKLSSFFNSKVELKRDSKGTVKMVISFKSENELNEIIDLVDKAKSIN